MKVNKILPIFIIYTTMNKHNDKIAQNLTRLDKFNWTPYLRKKCWVMLKKNKD